MVIGSERPPGDGGKQLCEMLHLVAARKRQGFKPGFGNTGIRVICWGLANGSVPAPHAVSTVSDTRGRCVQQTPVNGSPGGVVSVGLARLIAQVFFVRRFQIDERAWWRILPMLMRGPGVNPTQRISV